MSKKFASSSRIGETCSPIARWLGTGVQEHIEIRSVFRVVYSFFVTWQNRTQSDRCCSILTMMLPQSLRPMRLSRRAEPFDSDQFIYELKIDASAPSLSCRRSRRINLPKWKRVPWLRGSCDVV